MKSILFFLFSALLISISFGQFTNIQIDNAGSPEEPSIAINPKNPNQVIAGANIDFYYYSSNGGTNWTKGTLIDNTSGVWGDPCMSFDTAGNAYFIHLSNPPNPGWWIDRIVCAKSTNAGVSYINPGAFMGHNPNGVAMQDKAWNAVDWTHGSRGNWMYCTWTQFDYYGSTSPGDSSRILFSRSTSAGTNWLDPPIRINTTLSGTCLDDDNTMEGAVPAVGPNGELYVGWAGPKILNSQYGIYFQKSTDGGVTWLAAPIYVCDQPGGWDYNINGIYRANGLPITCCDISRKPTRGTIYINWTDQAGVNDHDVKMVKSTNGGLNWSTPVRVNNDPAGKEQFFTWMCVDQATGFLFFVFYDRRNYTDNLTTDVYLARSSDGGNTFTNFVVSASSFVPNSSTFFGDYTNITAAGGHVRPIWARLVGSQISVWTALVEFPVAVENNQQKVPESYTLSQNYPNPFNPSTTIKFTVPKGSKSNDVKIEIYDILGKKVADLVNEHGMAAGTYEITWHAENFSSGIYFYTMRTNNYTETKKMILTK